MALGIVSDEDFMGEFNNSSSDTNISIYQDKKQNSNDNESEDKTSPVITSDILPFSNPGRHSDVPNIPQSLRKILGEEVSINGLKSAMQLADSLGSKNGISQPTLNTYARGEVSPGKTNNDLIEHINGRKGKITKRALNKLSLAMSLIDETKLLGCDAKELSSVAKDMAQIVNHMEPTKSTEDKKEPVQFHFYAPQIRNEAHYETVVAKDNY